MKPVNHYLALGDSYTIGEGITETERWPEQWAKRMNEQGHAIEQPVRIIAKTGWTTDELLQAIDDAGKIGTYQYVSLLIGVNNQYRGRSIDEFKTEFMQLAEKAIYFAGNKPQHVFVLSIPDWGQTPFGQASGCDTSQISQEIDSFNLAAEKLCQQLKISYWDITAITRENSKNTLMHAEDGLHPSQLMYEIWINTLFSH
ncbi:MAG: SGNH/GDSL hydrolase family protein [Arenimonas sp.]|nr:SGNH/GDSL hydrolase family protein [Arenimonas sp.]